jgi:hypothetical protein
MLRGRVRKMEEAQKREEGQRKEGAVWMEEGKNGSGLALCLSALLLGLLGGCNVSADYQ